ncbi:MAG: ATP-binding protein [bacterium]
MSDFGDCEHISMTELAALRSERDSAAEQVSRRLTLERALAEVSQRITCGAEFDYDQALAVLGAAVDVHRVRVFRFRDNLVRVDNVLEWCAEGVKPQQAMLQDLQSNHFGWWLDKMKRGEDVIINDLTALPPEAASERRLLEMQGARSVLAVRLTDTAGKLDGFIGFIDEARARHWSPDDVRILRVASELFSIAFAHEHFERELKRKNEALTAALSAKSDFLSIVSHELRAPLTVILGHADVLLQQGDFSDRLQERTSLQAIQRNALKLRMQIGDLLTLAAADHEQIKLQLRPVPVLTLLRELVYDYEQTTLDKPVLFDLQGNDIEIWADAERLRQVLDNLVDNAIKFSEKSAEIELHIGRVGHFGVLTVSDHGVGISAAYLPRALDRFSQQRPVLTRSHQGCGLGLAIVEELITMMGGRVELSSQEGLGTRVTISLPVAESNVGVGAGTAADPGRITVREPLGQRPRVVVIDDDPEALDLIAAILEPDFDVAVFRSSQQAMEHLGQYAADLVLLDWMMPVMDGLSMLKHLKTAAKTVEIPVVFISGKADEPSIQLALESGAQAYLVKPFTYNALREEVARWVQVAVRSTGT